MDTTAGLLSPTSASPPSSFTLSSPRALSPPAGSPSSSSSFSFSPLPSPRPLASSRAASFSPRRTITGFPDLDSSSPWDRPRPLGEAFLCSRPPMRQRPGAGFEVSAYATTAEPPPLSTTATGWNSKKTHYALLGVASDAAPAEIRAAYRRLARLHHPDVSPLHQLPSATRLFAEINEAYSTLADPQRRARYDLKLALESPSAVEVTWPQPPQPSAASYATDSPRKYTDAATGRVYPSMNSFYREWRNARA